MQNYLNLKPEKESLVKAWDTVYEQLERHGYQPQYCSNTKKATIVYSNFLKHLFNYPSDSEVKNYLEAVHLEKYKIRIKAGYTGDPVVIELKRPRK